MAISALWRASPAVVDEADSEQRLLPERRRAGRAHYGYRSVINITFRVNETIGEAELCVRDNGRGMGPARSGSFGLRLVESLSRELGGRLTTPEISKGTRTLLTFPYSV